MNTAGKKEGKSKDIRRFCMCFLILVIYGFGGICQTGTAQICQAAQMSPKEMKDNLTENIESEESEEMQNKLLGEMEFEEIQQMIGQILGENSFSVKDAVRDMINGDEPISKETVREFLRSLFFSGIEQEKDTFFKLLLLILIAAVLANFADAFENGQVGDVSFYVVYLILFMSLVENFSRLSTSLSTRLSWLAEFMKVLSPAYFMAVTASVGASSAVVFYEGVLLMVWAIQWLLVNVFLPGVNLCILLKLVNHLSKEEMLSKMAELLEIVVNWGLKTLLGAAVGLQIVRNLVTPVMDSLKRSALGKTAGAIPVIGNAMNAITELILTSAVLVRNSLGVVFLILLALAGMGPAIHYGVLSLSYRFLAALSQPVSDKRIVGALSTMGEGCALLLKLLLTAEVLCMLTFLILMAGSR